MQKFFKNVPWIASFFSFRHTFIHIQNFHHVLTQSHENLRCLTEKKKCILHQITCLTSRFDCSRHSLVQLTLLCLFIIMSIIYAFTHLAIRKNVYKSFWNYNSLSKFSLVSLNIWRICHPNMLQVVIDIYLFDNFHLLKRSQWYKISWTRVNHKNTF